VLSLILFSFSLPILPLKVVHLDMDSFVLGPMDDLFDTKFAPKTEGGGNGTMVRK